MKIVHALAPLTLLAVLTLDGGRAGAAERPRLTLTVDASDAPRHLLHSQLKLAATPGPLTLRYAKWIPGEHAPTGPLIDVAGLVIRAGGKALAWRRDDVDLYAVRLEVPAGIQEIEVSLDTIIPEQSPTTGVMGTSELLALEWNVALVYPDGVAEKDLWIAPRIRLPHGWKHGSALAVKGGGGELVEFAPVTLETLVDSPLIAGRWFRSFSLDAPGAKAPHHVLDIVADAETALPTDAKQLEPFRRLVVEAYQLFGARHYGDYHFLLSLSDKIRHGGLEHHQSSNNRARERIFLDPTTFRTAAELLPHEVVHSWNGKFRRPEGLATGGFDRPMKGELLWVYEGLTTYLGVVLAVRSGLNDPDWSREELAATAALMEARGGRSWRPLADTAVAAQILRTGLEWTSLRRAVDYYPEGVLLWLDVDVTLRQRSGGSKSIDDFCRLFFGGPNRGAEVVPYTFDDVVAALQSLVPYDWRTFFKSRVVDVAPKPPLDGINHGGWRLVYGPKPNERIALMQKVDKMSTLFWSLGFAVKDDGHVVDVIPGSPAAKAGLAPTMKLIAVDGRKLSHEVLADRLKLARSPIELLVANGDFFSTLKVDYKGGPRAPHLERTAEPDLLGEILRPHAQTSMAPTR